MRTKGIVIYAGVFALAVILFLFLPQIDFATSRLFYITGRGFLLADWPPIVALYRMVPWVVWAVAALVATAATWLFLAARPIWRLDCKALVFVVASTALGPGLVANTALKDHWGRARPTQVEAFGGARQFTPAPLPATECASNCAFVSGHAAAGFSLIAFAFLLPPGRLRRGITVAALGAGAVIGLGRIVQGAHFLSDIVFAGLLVYGTTALLHWWIVERDGLATPRLIHVYRLAWQGAAAATEFAARALAAPAARLLLLIVATVILIGITIGIADRPLAFFFHARDADLRALFDFIGRLGVTYGYLTILGLAFVALHWGGSLPRLQLFARSMRAFSVIPAFLFISIAASGIAIDLLKFIFGRPRPKLLFNSGAYDFAWLGLRADHWSFPSGHSATIVALMVGLWCLWPRHLLFYILVATIVSLSRVVVGAHYLSDVLAGASIALLTTRGVALIFARSGIDLTLARRGRSTGMLPWPCRRFGRRPIAKPRTALRQAGPVASVDGERFSIGLNEACRSRIGSQSWPCASKPSTTPAAETRSIKP